jgi:Xaa-Pro dipeptidase
MLVNVERLKRKMDELDLDGVVATTKENVHYFTGVWSVSLEMFPHDGQCYAVVTRDRPAEPVFVSSVGEIDQVLDGFQTIRETVTFGTFYRESTTDIELSPEEIRLKEISVDRPSASDPLAALGQALKLAGLADEKVGVDETGLRPGYFDSLAETLPRATFVPGSSALEWVRRVKTEEEIRRIRAAARITERAIQAAAGIAVEGVTEHELMCEFRRSIVSQGAIPRFNLIRIGRNAVAGQVLPDRTPLKLGDTIWFDAGCTYCGYWSDVARNVSLGEPSSRVQSVYQAMLEGEERGIAATRPGMTGGELFDLTVEAVREAGVPGYRRHHVGHGIGGEVYEQPLLAPNNKTVIEEGMVLNIETPYYEFGLGALHVEDPYVVGSDGHNQLLTTLSRELWVMDP